MVQHCNFLLGGFFWALCCVPLISIINFSADFSFNTIKKFHITQDSNLLLKETHLQLY